MKLISTAILVGLTAVVAGCSTVQNLRSSVGGSTRCEAIDMTRAEYEAYLELGQEKPYYCAINVPRAVPTARVAAE